MLDSTLEVLSNPNDSVAHWTWKKSLCFGPWVQSRLRSFVWWHVGHSARWQCLTASHRSGFKPWGQSSGTVTTPHTPLPPSVSWSISRVHGCILKGSFFFQQDLLPTKWSWMFPIFGKWLLCSGWITPAVVWQVPVIYLSLFKWSGERAKAVSDLSPSKEETSAWTSLPSHTGAAGGDHPSEAGGAFGSLLPKLTHTKQFSSLIHFTQFYLFKSQPTELREGRAGYRCDRAAGTLNDLRDALEFEDFP